MSVFVENEKNKKIEKKIKKYYLQNGFSMVNYGKNQNGGVDDCKQSRSLG